MKVDQERLGTTEEGGGPLEKGKKKKKSFLISLNALFMRCEKQSFTDPAFILWTRPWGHLIYYHFITANFSFEYGPT